MLMSGMIKDYSELLSNKIEKCQESYRMTSHQKNKHER